MNGIGGFFELELPHGGTLPHERALGLSTGRGCLTLMLQELEPKIVYVPFYTCDATLEPFRTLGIQTRYYGLDEYLFPIDLPEPAAGEYFLWTDYFGICRRHTNTLKAHFGRSLLIDDTHNFFTYGHQGYWSFTSARKYFGVPDGAFLYSPRPLSVDLERFRGVSLTHGVLRRLGRGVEAFAASQSYEHTLDCRVAKISEISEGLLRGVDFPAVAALRRENFRFYHSRLGSSNQLEIDMGEQVPFSYPYLPTRPITHTSMHRKGFFIPVLWPDVIHRDAAGFEWEKYLAANTLHLPVDHRYFPEDLTPIVEYILHAEGRE